MTRGIAAALAVVVLASAGCGSAKTVDTNAVEQGIKSQIKTQSPVSSVSCPSDVKAEKGATFDCSIKLQNGTTGKVKVTQLGASKYSYELVPGSVQVPGSVVQSELQKDLEAQGVSNPTVNCPDNIIVKLGTYFECDVTSGNGVTGTVKFTFSSASGTVDTSSVQST